jgi:hypothetical protein
MRESRRQHGKRPFWSVTYREARVHALIAAIVLWTGAAIATFAVRGDRNLVDHLKGEDFVQIYTLSHLAFEGGYPTPSQREQFHDRQVALVPASAPDHYLPVYPPTAALIFRPFTVLSYRAALALWSLITIGAYAWIVRRAWLPVCSVLPDGGFVARAAAAFPPFFLLVLYGQTTLVPLLAFFLCWLGLKNHRPVAAGLALGLLTVKPQFGAAIGAALLFAGNWKVILGLIASVMVQVAAVVAVLGGQALQAYARTMAEIPRIEYLLEPDGWRMHSIRTLTRLVPGRIGEMIWIGATAWIVIAAVRVWRGSAPLDARFGFLLLASVLVNPHLFGYDAVILVLSGLWLGAWLEEIASPIRAAFWQASYLLSLLLLVPTAAFIRLQLSVVVMLWLFWRVGRELMTARAAHSLSQ